MKIVLTPVAQKMFEQIRDRRIREKLAEKINGLAEAPEQQGKPLHEELASYRSVRAVGQRYRIIYKVEKRQVTVLVLTLGLRKAGSKQDVYALAKKFARLYLT